MKQMYFLLFAFALIISIVACNSQSSTQHTDEAAKTEGKAAAQKGNSLEKTAQSTNSKPQLLSAQAFKDMAEKTENAIILDVRTARECKETGTIKNAKQLDFYQKASFTKTLQTLPKDQPIMVYCAAGGRSGKAAKMLSKMGFAQVYDLEGGMGAWKSASLPTEN